MNFIDGRVDPAARAFISDGLALGLGERQLETIAKRELVTLGIRPEHVEISMIEGDGWASARVHVTEMMGNETLVFLTLGREKIVARAAGDFRAEIDAPAWARFDMTRAIFFDQASGQSLLN